MTTEATELIERPDVAAIRARLAPIVHLAKSLVVTDAITYEAALELGKRAQQEKAFVEAILGPSIAKANALHKELTSTRAELFAPLEEIKAECSRKSIAWKREQEAIVEAERRRLEEEQRRAEEARQLEDAMAAEAAGDTEQAEEILAAPPAPVAPVYVPPAAPKVRGAVTATTWKAQVENKKALIKWVASHIDERPELETYLDAAMPVLNALARSQKALMRVPGARAVEEDRTRFSKTG